MSLNVTGVVAVVMTVAGALLLRRCRGRCAAAKQRPAESPPAQCPNRTAIARVPLDPHNRDRAGRQLAIPLHVQRQAGAAFGELRRLSVQVSYDEGRTWRPVPLTGSGWQRIARVSHPHAAGSVSLRASAVDSRGSTAERTIIRAYLTTL